MRSIINRIDSERRAGAKAARGLAACLALLASFPALAAEYFDFYSGPRQLAMGDCYTGVVNDETSLLTNPAGLGKIREFTFNLANPQLEISSTATDAFNSANYSQALEAQGILDALNQAKGKPYDMRASVFPSVVMPNFGVGAMAKVWYNAMVDSAGQTFTFDYVNDYVGALGYNLRFFGGVVKLGFAGRVINRSEVRLSVPATSTGLQISSLKRSGMGIASDIGTIVTLPIVWLPSISAVARDVGGTSYNLSPGMFGATTYRPNDTPSRIDVGFSVFPIVSNRVRASVTLEAHGVNTLSEETDSMKRYHAGMELNVADFFFLRGGLNQRYWTAGVEFATEYFQLQATSYGEEVGTAATNVEDRRYLGAFAIRW